MKKKTKGEAKQNDKGNVNSSQQRPLTEFKEEEFIIGLFEDGFYPGEIVEAINDGTINVSFLQPVVSTTSCCEEQEEF